MNGAMKRLYNTIRRGRTYHEDLTPADQSRAIELEKRKLIRATFGPWSGSLIWEEAKK